MSHLTLKTYGLTATSGMDIDKMAMAILLRLGRPSAKARLGRGSLDHLMEAKHGESAPDMGGGTTATRKELHMNDKQ